MGKAVGIAAISALALTMMSPCAFAAPSNQAEVDEAATSWTDEASKAAKAAFDNYESYLDALKDAGLYPGANYQKGSSSSSKTQDNSKKQDSKDAEKSGTKDAAAVAKAAFDNYSDYIETLKEDLHLYQD